MHGKSRIPSAIKYDSFKLDDNLDPKVSNDFQPQFQLVLKLRVILVGIFFRKPKTEGAPSAADERRIQNSDTSKIR